MDVLKHYIEHFALHQYLNIDLLRCLQTFELAAHTELYVQNEELTTLYFLVKGKVQVGHDHANGKQAVLAMLTPLATIGDLELFTNHKVTTTIITLEKSILLGIEKSLVMRYGYDDQRFLRFVIDNLTNKLYRSGVIHVGQVLPVVNRLAAYLLENEDNLILPPKTHLAGLLGTTPRHLNRVIKQLETVDIIHVKKQMVKILNRKLLEIYAQA